jgi:cyanophycinase
MTERKKESNLSAPTASAPVRRVRQGPVMPIGGAEDKGEGDEIILSRFVELAGGKRARIAVVPTASEEPAEMGERYIKVFTKLGASSVDVVDIKERPDANAPATLELLGSASGIFITGGAQDRLVELLVGTLAMECIRNRNADGVAVAGTSAGASIVAAHVMLGGTGLAGTSNDASARKAMVEVVAGFGLLQDVIVDQHFSQRGRMGRLMSAFASNPGLIGIGLDEDTAVLINREGTLEVLGSGMVTLVDGRNARSNYFDIEHGEVLTVVDSSLHILGCGRLFDLNERRALPFAPNARAQ